MPKLKTKQFIAKRIRIRKSMKIIKKTAGQDHFNSRESGKQGTNKRKEEKINKTSALYKSIRKLVPYY